MADLHRLRPLIGPAVRIGQLAATQRLRLRPQARLRLRAGGINELQLRRQLTQLHDSEFHAELNRPGSGGGTEATGEWFDASTEEVSERVA